MSIHYHETKAAAVMEAILNLILSVALVIIIPVWEFKMVGVAIGTLAANLFRTSQYAIYIEKHVIQRGSYVFILKILWTLFNMALAVVLCRTFVGINIDSWLSWVGYSVLVGAFCFVIVLLSASIFYRKDMIVASQVFISMLKRRK
ncbi:hypothetical protein [Oribacterium sp. NK2B42]|uniref:hypothetical protein n=1 Tax=Oribacterium sp. NK2B42 TaxID=689781 RepID=UPI000492A406|nr:hypothetical protein [Oribacterium sp. NK2B42]